MEETLNTNARAVLDVLRASDKHPTALEVYEEVRGVRPHIGLATVYRILHQLTWQGLITELGRNDESCRYDGRTNRHDHAICTECGALLDIPVELRLLDEELQAAALGAGMILGRYEVWIYGQCSIRQAKAQVILLAQILQRNSML